MLYYSYGSNMSPRRLRQRAPSAEFVAVASLSGHTLRFHKVGKDGSAKCDVLFTGIPADQVLGVVYDISPVHKPNLDRVEGLGCGYEEKQIAVLTEEQVVLEAFTYYATSINQQLKPYHWYKEHVVRGCNEHLLPPSYVESISKLESIEDPDQDRSGHELAIYR